MRSWFEVLGFRWLFICLIWKRILSEAFVARDVVSGQFSENIKQGECDSPQRQLPKSIKCFCPTSASFVVCGIAEGGAHG